MDWTLRRPAGKWACPCQALLRLTYQLIEGLAHLHKYDVAHLDLKPDVSIALDDLYNGF